MTSLDIKKIKLPDVPGVYLFLRQAQDKSNKPEILYIGKATSIRDRVRSYFNKDLISSRGPRIIKMLELATDVGFQTTSSVLEALILEAQLIKKHQPFYNIDAKDDKSWWHVVITKENIPRVLMVRGKILAEQENDLPYRIGQSFGPFTSSLELREALKIIRKIFPYHDRKLDQKTKPCFEAQIGLCPGICAGWISVVEYKKQLRHIRLFFQGKKGQLIRQLEREMKDSAKAREFERAGELKRKIFALQHIQDVALIKVRPKDRAREQSFRVEAYDIAHLGGKETVGAMTVVENGEANKSQYRKFKIRGAKANQADDTANLEEVIQRRLKHQEWPLPHLVVVDGSKAQLNRMTKILETHNLSIPVVGVVKDDHHKPREIIGSAHLIHKHEAEILLANAEVHRFALAYHRKLRGRMI